MDADRLSLGNLAVVPQAVANPGEAEVAMGKTEVRLECRPQPGAVARSRHSSFTAEKGRPAGRAASLSLPSARGPQRGVLGLGVLLIACVRAFERVEKWALRSSCVRSMTSDTSPLAF